MDFKSDSSVSVEVEKVLVGAKDLQFKVFWALTAPARGQSAESRVELRSLVACDSITNY